MWDDADAGEQQELSGSEAFPEVSVGKQHVEVRLRCFFVEFFFFHGAEK